jgi:hypothetical protein
MSGDCVTYDTLNVASSSLTACVDVDGSDEFLKSCVTRSVFNQTVEGREELRNPQGALGQRSKPATNAVHRCPYSSLRLGQA